MTQVIYWTANRLLAPAIADRVSLKGPARSLSRKTGSFRPILLIVFLEPGAVSDSSCEDPAFSSTRLEGCSHTQNARHSDGKMVKEWQAISTSHHAKAWNREPVLDVILLIP
jgi:hypothetical protein